MGLGFTVSELADKAWMGGVRRMGLSRIAPDEWLWPEVDRAARAAAFDAHPDSLAILPEGEAPAHEAAQLVARTDDFALAARSVWEDLCLLTEGPDGHYRLVAGALGFPTHWRLADKLGGTMDAIHVPVGGYAGPLGEGVNRFFEGLRAGYIFARSNWFVVPTADWRYQPVSDPVARYAHVTPDNAGETLFVRCERQTLRRLPGTGAVLFTIGIAVEPMAALDADLVGRIAQAVATMPADEVVRRGNDHLITPLQGYAARRHSPAETVS